LRPPVQSAELVMMLTGQSAYHCAGQRISRSAYHCAD
jgi:hypothetical protein